MNPDDSLYVPMDTILPPAVNVTPLFVDQARCRWAGWTFPIQHLGAAGVAPWSPKGEQWSVWSMIRSNVGCGPTNTDK